MILFLFALGTGGLAHWQFSQAPGAFDLSAQLRGKVQEAQKWMAGKAPARDAPGATDPRAGLRTEVNDGWQYNSPGVLQRAGAPETAQGDSVTLIVGDLAQGFAPSDTPPAPARMVGFDPKQDCRLRRPQEGETLYNIRLEGGSRPSGAHVFSHEALADALITHISGIASGNGRNYKIGKMAQGQMAVVDVFVTDRSAPVYLFLQGHRTRIIWNLHLADGVYLAHVAMIGEYSGLAGLPDGVGYEALRISDFVGKDEFGSNDSIRPCMIVPWRTPQPEWLTYRKAQRDNDLFQNRLYTYNSGARAYGAWYDAAIGRAVDENLITAKEAAHVLAGPRPDAPLNYTPLSTRTALVTRADNMLIGDATLRQTHDALLADAVGGDIALLNPTPMEIPAQ